MERTRVSSSDIASVGYEEVSSTLEIEFNSGGIYRYLQVPYHVYKELMAAPSHGKYFHRAIKSFFTTIRIR